ncbi:Structure-specific endonuclease subunit SLX4 [Anthophora quadrimaculata]
MGEHFEENKNLYNTHMTAEHDSILDFKSPEQFPKRKPSEFNNSNIHKKKKATIKIGNSSKNHKNVKVKQKRNLQEPQSSSESSGFKFKNNRDDKDFAINMKVALVCPLCFKTFKDFDSRTLHMKICAYKKNIPTKKLLDAIELQKRQEDERKSLGLPIAPVLQDKKKSMPCKTSLYEESDLQLALALSKSLQEAEKFDTITKTETTSKLSNQFVLEGKESIYEGQLEKFGFASNKLPSFVKNKKRRNLEITVLQTRSLEERNRILTEKISEILMGDEPITQNQKQEIKCNNVIDKETVLKSYLLKKLCNKEEKLWDKAKLTSKQKYFYVPNLSEHIIPEEKQIAEETISEFTNTFNIHDIKLNQYKIETYKNEEVYATLPAEPCFATEKCENCRNRQFINTIVTNWADALNDSSASDIIIFVNNDKYIWAHKLVFYVQCSNILLDVTPNDISRFAKIKEKICWTDISYNIALAFLEFIYCGIIQKYLNVLQDLTSVSTLRSLARKYKVKELFMFLQKKEIEIKQEADRMHTEHSEELISKEENNLKLLNDRNMENLISDSKDFEMDANEILNEKYVKDYTTDEPESVEFKLEKSTCIEQLLEKEICLKNVSSARNCNASPDLFEDVNDTLKNERTKNKANRVEQCTEIQETKIDEDFSTLDSVDEETIEPAQFSKVENISFKNTAEFTNLSSNSVYVNTPRKKYHPNIRRSKSNLSLFIEQFQAENAKSDFDSDSETLILPTRFKLCRNPFNVKQRDNSNEDCIFNEKSIEKSIEKALEREKDILSVFDRVTDFKLDAEVLQDESDTDISLNLDSVDNTIELSKSKVGDCTMKYETDNSTDKEINDAGKEQDEIIHSVSKGSVNSNVENRKSVQNLSTLQHSENQDHTFSDFDTDEDDTSMYSKYKMGHENNSIIKYRDFVQKHILTSSVKDGTIHEYRGNKNLDNYISLLNTDEDSKFAGDLVKEHNDLMESKKLTSNYKNCKEISGQVESKNPCNLTNECVINEKYDYLSTIIRSPISTTKNIKNQRINKSNSLRYSKSDSTIDLQASKQNSLISIKPNANSNILLDFRISVASSPELESNILNVHKCEERKTIKSASDSEKFNNIEDDIYLANVYINDENDTDISSCSKGVHKLNEETATMNENNVSIKTNNNSFIQKLTNNEGTLIRNRSNRKFQRKSMSETNFYDNSKGIQNDASVFYNNLNKSQYRCKSPEIIRDNVTPPPNYNEMKTPELHAELNKYGLKIQKRKRATKLLTHIYNELHPTVYTASKNVECDLAVISSEEDEPPMKKVNCKQNHVDYIHKYDECQLPLSQGNTVDMQLSTNIINEEKQYDEQEAMYVANNVPDIKDVFSKLLTVNRELHDKILSYEPLCINSLRSMLKAEGFRCKINTLMDFLDEQCITFYCQETKHKKDKLIFA